MIASAYKPMTKCCLFHHSLTFMVILIILSMYWDFCDYPRNSLAGHVPSWHPADKSIKGSFLKLDVYRESEPGAASTGSVLFVCCHQGPDGTVSLVLVTAPDIRSLFSLACYVSSGQRAMP